MASMNRVFLMGNLTRDPELRHTTGGSPVANLRLAINRAYTGKDGERKEEASFFTVVAWGRQAEVCSEYLKKGSPLMVEGWLQTRLWQTGDGQKRNTTEVVATRVQFLGKKGSAAAITAFEEEVSAHEPGNGETTPDEENPDEVAVAGKPNEDGIPF